MTWNGKHRYKHVLPIWMFSSVFPQDHIFKAKVKCMPHKCMPLGMIIFFSKRNGYFVEIHWYCWGLCECVQYMCLGWILSFWGEEERVTFIIYLLLFYFYSTLPFYHFFLMAMIQKNFFVFLFSWIVAHWLCSLVGWDVSLWGYCNVTKGKHFHKKQINFPHLQWDDFF